MPKKIIVISPHPDDETFAAGGALLKHKALGGKIYWLNITDVKEEYGFTGDTVQRREGEIKKITAEYGFDGFFNLALRPFHLDNYPAHSVIAKIAEIFSGVKPDTVILPYKNDIHSDHRVAFECAYACTKIFRHPYVRQVLMAEVISETDFCPSCENFSPNYFVDVSDYMKEKLRIMKIYESEVGPHPFPRSEEGVKALATIRGIQAGCKYAEGFMVLKEIQ